jgi:hypothetical protein
MTDVLHKDLTGADLHIPGTHTHEVFPVGSVFLAIVSTDPNTLLGYGTWSAIAAGRVLVGLDAGQAKYDTPEETGGDETQTPSAHAGATVGAHDNHIFTQPSAHDNHIFTQPSAHAAKNTDAADTGATGKGATASTLTLKAHFHNISQYTHAGGAVDAHSAHAGGAVDAHSAHSVGQANNHSAMSIVQPYFVVYMWKRTA